MRELALNRLAHTNAQIDRNSGSIPEEVQEHVGDLVVDNVIGNLAGDNTHPAGAVGSLQLTPQPPTLALPVNGRRQMWSSSGGGQNVLASAPTVTLPAGAPAPATLASLLGPHSAPGDALASGVLEEGDPRSHALCRPRHDKFCAVPQFRGAATSSARLPTPASRGGIRAATSSSWPPVDRLLTVPPCPPCSPANIFAFRCVCIATTNL